MAPSFFWTVMLHFTNYYNELTPAPPKKKTTTTTNKQHTTTQQQTNENHTKLRKTTQHLSILQPRPTIIGQT